MSSLTRQVDKAKSYMRDMMPNKFDYEEIRQSDETAHGTSDEFAKSHLLGSKSLGLFSSIVIVVNNIAGPGMLVLPMVYQVLTNAIKKRTYVHICLARMQSLTHPLSHSLTPGGGMGSPDGCATAHLHGLGLCGNFPRRYNGAHPRKRTLSAAH